MKVNPTFFYTCFAKMKAKCIKLEQKDIPL